MNVLVALAWPNHQHHEAAHRWLGEAPRRGWATCALTELAFVRLSSNPTVIKNAVNPADAITLLRRMRAHPGHRFWQKLPRLDALGHLGLAGHQQVTDAYLALVAKANDGVLATFDAAVAAWFRREKLIEVLPT